MGRELTSLPWWCVLLSLAATPVWGEPGAGEKLFALRVWPLFAEKCLACHGNEADKFKGGFDMRSREALLAGGEVFGEEVVFLGEGEKSLLYRVTARMEADYEMPPKEADRLSEEQAWWIRDWIDAGAPWVAEERVAELQAKYAEGVVVETSGGLSEDWNQRRYREEDLWAYRPLRRPEVPVVEGWEHPVDAFVGASLGAVELEAAPRAEAGVLIRRASFDLLGLPPAPEEVEAFVEAAGRDAEGAWRDLIERLLGSPHYGEQWARHWLDVARYADSSGFANDYERPNAWRYRDYVIRSFNGDKPYDRFVREQIAGDEMGRREDPEMLVATGFLRMGPWEHTGMSVAKETRQQFLDDITDSVGQVFLAHALQCARCHDHKFDPVPARDYYSMQAVFATTQFAEVETGWLAEENLAGMEEDKGYHEKRLRANRALLAELEAKKRAYEAEWFAEQGLPWKSKEEAKKAGARESQLPTRVLRSAEEFGLERIGRKWSERFGWEMDRYEPLAYAVYNGKTSMPRGNSGRIRMPEDPMKQGELEETAILAGGDPFSPTERVRPGVLSAVAGVRGEIPEAVEGRRTALAEWISSGQNGMTARVMANRIWQYHFGRGLAANPNNFGTTGKKPSHPELLDWLAAEFVASGWSVKEMHRLILTSETYRRSTAHPRPEELASKDPEGGLLAVFAPRRLAAEELRDAMLAVSGELNPEMGGIPIRPDMNLEAALQPRMIMGTFAPSYVPSPRPEQRNRRTIYAHKTRGQRDPFLEVFNQPGPDQSCEMRDSSNVTPQVFTLFNSEESMDRALAFAARVLRETAEQPEEAAVDRAFSLAFGRMPYEGERTAALAHWKEMEGRQARQVVEPRKRPTVVVREANEENTGEIFQFCEELFVYEEYEEDLQPNEVDARTRALGDLCLVLFNANEFSYVY